LGKLTEANLKRPLAFLIDDKVVCIATIQAKIVSTVMISFGPGSDPTVAQQIVQSLKQGMPPALVPAATQPENPSTNPVVATQPAGLNADQQTVLDWTNNDFRQFFDNRKFTGWTDQEKQNLEDRCIDALSGPQDQGYYQSINTLAALRSTKALPKLRELAFEHRDKNNRDRWMSVRALGLMGDKQSVPQLIHLVYHGNDNTRWWAQISLVWLTGQNFGGDWNAWGKWWNGSGQQPPFDPTVISWYAGQPMGEKLVQTLSGQDRQFLGQLRDVAAPATHPTTAPDKPSAAEAVRSAVTIISTCAEGDPRIANAIRMLKGLDENAAVAETAKYLSSDDDNTRRAAIYVLWRGEFKSIGAAIDPLTKLCKHKEDFTRGMAAMALGGHQVLASEATIVDMATTDKSNYARRCAAYALGLLGDTNALPVLGKLGGDSDAGVAQNAKAAIKMLNTGPRG
jgi:HEAT repeat protein